MSKRDVTQEELSKRLTYDPKTGELVWTSKGNSRKVVVGSRAGSATKRGHRVIRLNGYTYPEHHIIWRLYFGVWPKGHIDHINHDEMDNRLTNLRDVSQEVNNRNQSLRKDNTTGHIGIWINNRNSKKKFMSEVVFGGKRVHRESHYSIEDAIECRNQVLQEYGFHPNHGIEKPV